MELKPSGRVVGSEINSIASSESIISSRPAQVQPESAAGLVSSGRVVKQDGSITNLQSLAQEKFDADKKSREELIASIRDKEERQAQGTPVVFTKEEELLMAQLAIPAFEATAEYYEQSSLAEDENPYYQELKARGDAAVQAYGGTPSDVVPLATKRDNRLSKAMQSIAERNKDLETGSGVEGAGNFFSMSTFSGDLETFYEEKVFPNLDDGALKSFLQTAGDYGMGAEAFNTILALGKSVDYTTSAYKDVAQAFFEGVQENAPDFYKMSVGMDPRSAANSFARETGNFLTYLETMSGGILPATSLRLASGLSSKEVKDVARAVAAETSKFKKIDGVILAEKTTRAERRAAAVQAANANAGLRSDFIKQFEQSIGARSMTDIDIILDENKIISAEKDGLLVLDPKKYREVGRNLLDNQGVETTGQLDLLKTAETGEVPEFMFNVNALTRPSIKPENFEAFTAVAADVMKRAGVTYDPSSGKRLVDVVFELSVDQEIVPEGELLSLLNKYDLSFEDYATMMVGSVSDAGRTLRAFQEITRRVKPRNEVSEMKEAKLLDTQNTFFRTFTRVENVRRGLLVSQVATAARNLSSGGVRAPLEGLQNVFDTALYNYSKDGLVAGSRSLVDVRGNWADSFRHLKYTFDPRNYNHMKEYTDYILDRPELATQSDRMFNQINEIRRSQGAGAGGALDNILSAAEKGVDVINGPNRWQEYLIRRGTFTAELERLVKREYDIDLIDTINQGKMSDLLNDSPDLVGTGNTPFKELLSASVDKALDITYAKQPETQVFREMTSFITRNGLTIVAPFPRFMFNSMELAGEYSGVPAIYQITKRTVDAALKKGGPITPSQRRQISRGIIGGLVIIPAAMQYRNSEDAPADYKFLRKDDGTLLDTSAQSPILRQALWIAELGKRNDDGSLNKWLETSGFREGMEAFVGTNIRTGSGGVLFQDITNIFSSVDAGAGEKSIETLGKLFGEYATTYLTPLNQVIETQRALGYRPDEYVDNRNEPNPTGTLFFGKDSAFVKGFLDSPRRRGMTTFFSPSDEEKRPARETLFQDGDVEPRVGTLSKVFTGITQRKDVSETGKFLMGLGFADYKLRPRTISPGFQRYETKVLRFVLPSIVEAVQSKEVVGSFQDMARMRTAEARADLSDEAFVRIQQTNLIEEEISRYKREVDGIITAESEEVTNQRRDDLTTVDGKPVNVELTELLQLHQQFRRMKPSQRRAAFTALPFLINEFGDEIGLKEDEREPSMANSKHIAMMIDYIKD